MSDALKVPSFHARIRLFDEKRARRKSPVRFLSTDIYGNKLGQDYTMAQIERRRARKKGLLFDQLATDRAQAAAEAKLRKKPRKLSAVAAKAKLKLKSKPKPRKKGRRK